MLCPVDKHPMIVVEYAQIELDHCPQCKGVWFDAGELDLLLKSGNCEFREDHCRLELPHTKVTEKKRKCPICKRDMQKRLVGNPPDIMIDACGLGHGLWFDGGELNQFLKSFTPKSGSHPISNFMNEVFKVLG